MPSRDPAAEARYFSEALGAKLVFAIEAFGARVAMVELTEDAPALLFADHLDGSGRSSSTASPTSTPQSPS